MAVLVDTNVLVYRFDPRFPAKQAIAVEVLRRGIEDGSLCVPYQALMEFVSVVTRPTSGKGPPLLAAQEAHEEAETLMMQLPVLYPTETTFRTALRGAALYRLSWFDAHLWAYADEHGIDTILSEDFERSRLYGRVRVVDPFSHSVHEPD